MKTNSPLVTTDWLADHIHAPDVRVADASWYLPKAGRDPRAEYESAHIPGAIFFNIDQLSDETNPSPHMLAPAPKFASGMRRLGLGDGNLIVVYDGAGVYSAARAWWMLRAMGHEDVVVLDGGFPKWKREHREVEDMIPAPYPRHFTPRPNNTLLRAYDQILVNVSERTEQIVDVRGRARFAGLEEEPRPGVRPGHIPGSLNVPYTEFIAEDGTLKPADTLAALFRDAGLDITRPTVTTCGSGITAAIGLLALNVIGAKSIALYDGSWAEWGANPDAPIEKT